VTHQRKNDRNIDEWQPLEEVVSKDIFKAEVWAWAIRIRVEPKELHVRPMSRKWGSCSTAGRVTFDASLMSQPADFRKEVIVHELLHLKVPNHGTLFRSLLRAYLGKTNVGSLEKHTPILVGR
jgi:predicted metal-dependent hydrolase